MKYLFINNENIDVCLPLYLRISMTIWLKRYTKLTPDSTINKKVKEIMRYMGDTGHPLCRKMVKIKSSKI